MRIKRKAEPFKAILHLDVRLMADVLRFTTQHSHFGEFEARSWRLPKALNETVRRQMAHFTAEHQTHVARTHASLRDLFARIKPAGEMAQVNRNVRHYIIMTYTGE